MYPDLNITSFDNGILHTSTLGIDILAEKSYFKKKRRMKIKCVASLFNVYYKVNEISVEKKRRKRKEKLVYNVKEGENQSGE